MATDYDAPRRDEVDLGEDSLEELKARRVDSQSGAVDVDEAEVAESFELPGADLADEELTVKVLPMQQDEFRTAADSWRAGDKSVGVILEDAGGGRSVRGRPRRKRQRDVDRDVDHEGRESATAATSSPDANRSAA